jgi:hypothetical protein
MAHQWYSQIHVAAMAETVVIKAELAVTVVVLSVTAVTVETPEKVEMAATAELVEQQEQESTLETQEIAQLALEVATFQYMVEALMVVKVELAEAHKVDPAEA